MNSRYKSIVKRVLFVLGGIMLLVLGSMFIVPKLYIDKINTEVRTLIKEQVKGDVTFERIDLTFFKKFPNLTATIEKPIIGGVPLDSTFTEPLFEAKSLSLGIDLLGLLNSSLNFDKVFVEEPFIRVLVNEEGLANYDIFHTQEEKEESEGSFDLKINVLHIKSANVIYNDLAGKISFIADDFEYVGRGNMSDAVFDLESKALIKSFDFNFDGVHYIKEKPIAADLETTVNTESLRFGFNRSDIKIKDLPVNFQGFFGFVENGYDMLFDIKTTKANLVELFSIIPPEYQGWLDKTRIEGKVAANLKLEGKYVVSEKLSPSLDFGLTVENGLFQHGELNVPLTDLNFILNLQIPNLDFQANKIDIPSLSFRLNEKESHLQHQSSGLDRLELKTDILLNTDLKLFTKAVGLSGFDMSGELHLEGTADGIFTKGIRETKTLRKTVRDTIIASIPTFDINLKVDKGYFKFAELPEAIKEVNLDISAIAKDFLIKNVAINLSNLELLAMDNRVHGQGKIKNLSNFDMEATLDAKVDLDNLKQFIPIEEMELKGLVDIDGSINGSFEPKQKRYPIINAEFKMENGLIRFDRVPDLPIEDIHIHTIVNSKRGSLSDLSIKVLPIDFKIGGEPFQLAASLYNLNNLNYNVRSKGTLNLDSFYKLFKIEGLDIKGKLITNLFLSGLQSDALNGNFDKLKNGGSFEVADIWVASDLFPNPLWVKKGKFKFFKEKMKFEHFEAQYGTSKFNMNGYLTNVIDYMFNQDTLRGEFELETAYMNIDEFMVFGNSKESTSNTSSTAASGVIQVPSNLNLNFHAKADKIKYTDYILTDFNGDLHLDNGRIILNETTFDMIGTKVHMTGDYVPEGLRKASFNYTIKASEFDIQRAYSEVALFREMVSMAKDAYGQVSLDYTLQGGLDKNMMPVMNSVKGGGILSLDNIQFKGFKLLGAIAEKTEASSLENGSVSDVDIHSTIEDNVLTIDRTRMRMAGFRPRFEGQVSLDGELNIGLRLGLPPLGIVGIPMRITGTSDDFKIKLGKYKPSEVLGKVDYDDEDEDENDVESVNDLPLSLPEDIIEQKETMNTKTEDNLTSFSSKKE